MSAPSALRAAIVAHIAALGVFKSVERQVGAMTAESLKRAGSASPAVRLVAGRARGAVRPPRDLDLEIPFDAVVIARTGARGDAGDAALDLAAALAAHMTLFRPAAHGVAGCSLVREIDVEPIDAPDLGELAVVSVGFEVTLTVGLADPALLPPAGEPVGAPSTVTVNGETFEAGDPAGESP